MRILVDPEHLRSLSDHWRRVSAELEQLDARLGSTYGHLQWEARRRANTDGRVDGARGQVRRLAAHAAELARYLAAKAQAFEEADRAQAGGLAQGGLSALSASRGVGRWGTYPRQQVDAWLALGQSVDPRAAGAVHLPEAGGGVMVVGLASLGAISARWGAALQELGQRVWARIKGLLGLGEGAGSPEQGAEEPSGFGKLLEQEREQGETEAREQSSDAPPADRPDEDDEPGPLAELLEQEREQGETEPVVQEPIPAQVSHRDENGWKVVPQSQQGLRYGKHATQYGCVPTSASMILDFWHRRDPENQTKSAQELLDINVAEDEFGATGMSPTHILDEMKDLGYDAEQISDKGQDVLKAHLENGPVMAIVRLNMRTSGNIHAVVVSGVTEDNQQVQVSDPWTGATRLYSWDEFDQSWNSDLRFKDGTKGPQRNLIVIRPKEP